MRLFRKAQSILEYCLLAVVIMAALAAMQVYMKRGLQGRWKDSVDQLGDQYDPSMSGSITHKSTSQTSTVIDTNSSGSTRTDTDNSTETTKGSMQGSMK